MAARDSSSGQETEDVLCPGELDISTDENVAHLESGRFAVGSDGPSNEDKVQKVRSELATTVEEVIVTIENVQEHAEEADETTDAIIQPTQSQSAANEELSGTVEKLTSDGIVEERK